jgi:ABC-type multidrug transport system ATPase subunit
MTTKAIKIQGLEKIFYLGLFSPIPYLRDLPFKQLSRKVHALKGLDLDVEQGEIFGFLGHNGAGKSTTMKILTGLIQATHGSAEVFGLKAGSPESRELIGFLPELPQFYDDLNAVELLDFAGALCGLDQETRSKRAFDLLEQVHMTHAMYRPLRKLSKGMLQRIAVIQAFINHPKLIILDEPMSGLDPIGRKEIRELILRHRELGATIFLSSHILPDIEMICDRFAILDQGQLKAIDRIDTLWHDQSEMEILVAFKTQDQFKHLAQWDAWLNELMVDQKPLYLSYDLLVGRRSISLQNIIEPIGEVFNQITHCQFKVRQSDVDLLLTKLLSSKISLHIAELKTVQQNLEEVFIRYTQGQ